MLNVENPGSKNDVRLVRLFVHPSEAHRFKTPPRCCSPRWPPQRRWDYWGACLLPKSPAWGTPLRGLQPEAKASPDFLPASRARSVGAYRSRSVDWLVFLIYAARRSSIASLVTVCHVPKACVRACRLSCAFRTGSSASFSS